MGFFSSFFARGQERKPARARSRSKSTNLTSRGWQPTLEFLEDRTVPSAVSTIASNFNGTAIPAGDTLWFNSVFKASGVGSAAVTIRVTDQTIKFSSNGTDYTVQVPDAIINLSPTTSAADATTSYDAGQNAWVTNLPTKFSGNGFLSAVAFNAGVRLPGGINPVTWQASFSASRPGISLNWQWGAAVYSTFGSDPGVKPLDVKTSTYQNSDHAGTPENYRDFVLGGARGGGGSNYTGSYSATGKVAIPLDSQPGGLSGYVYLDNNNNGVRDDGDSGIVGVTITLYDESFTPIRTTTTNSDGSYSFSDLVPGTYVIQEDQAPGKNQGTNNVGSLGGDVGGDSFTVIVTPGADGTDYNFGELPGGG